MGFSRLAYDFTDADRKNIRLVRRILVASLTAGLASIILILFAFVSFLLNSNRDNSEVIWIAIAGSLLILATIVVAKALSNMTSYLRWRSGSVEFDRDMLQVRCSTGEILGRIAWSRVTWIRVAKAPADPSLLLYQDIVIADQGGSVSLTPEKLVNSRELEARLLLLGPTVVEKRAQRVLENGLRLSDAKASNLTDI